VQEVAALIQRVSPAVVVLELDEGRQRKLLEQAERGDTYGVEKLRKKSTLDVSCHTSWALACGACRGACNALLRTGAAPVPPYWPMAPTPTHN
jgi:hypothetical protein